MTMTHGHGNTGLLTSTTPCTTAPGCVTIGHVQLRDVLICPHDQGLVTYPEKNVIVEHDITLPPTSKPRRLAELPFTPVSLSAFILPGTNDTLLAAGGQEAELHLSYYSGSSLHPDGRYGRGAARGFGSREWEWKNVMRGASINNSVLLTSLSLTGSHESSAEPRVVISNNDESIKFFDVAVRREAAEQDDMSRLALRGELHLDVAVNHSSISPDGRTLLCVGDSPDVYLHRITGGSRITFAPIARLSLAPYLDLSPYAQYGGAHVPASFSTAFSGDGTKFAVASQEGVVAVWDVRSTKPLKVFETDKTRRSYGREPLSFAANPPYLDSYWDWTRGGGRGPGWGVRTVKFSPRGVGREVMTFTEHTNLLHIVDARTFETEEIIRMPFIDLPPPPPAGRRSSSPSRAQTPTEHAPNPYSPTTAPQPHPHTHQPRIVMLSNALGDTFRIPSSSSETSRWTRRASRDPRRGEDDLGLFVIPQLGDRQVENGLRRLLAAHPGRSIVLGRDGHGGREDELEQADEMDIDELESDCFSPSRSPSPPPRLPDAPAEMPASSATYLPAQPSTSRPPEPLRVPRSSLLARRESNGVYAPRGPVVRTGVARRDRRSQADLPLELDLDIAGTCFDPSGAFIYLASSGGVAEWKVRGAEQRWWSESTML